MSLFIAAGVIGALLLLTYLLTRSSSSAPVETPTGGTALAGSPSTAPVTSGTVAAVSVADPVNTPSATPPPPLPQPSTPSPLQLVPVVDPKLTSKILIIKDTSALTRDPGNNGEDWRTFQVAEIFAYEGSRKLVASDYSNATLSPGYGNDVYPASLAIDGNPRTFSHTGNAPIGVLTLTLKNPTAITRVEVLNRQDCCQGRLAGAKLILKNSADATIWSGVLSDAGDQVFAM